MTENATGKVVDRDDVRNKGVTVETNAGMALAALIELSLVILQGLPVGEHGESVQKFAHDIWTALAETDMPVDPGLEALVIRALQHELPK